MKNFTYILVMVMMLSLYGCSTTRYVPVKEVEREVVTYRDSVRLRDSIVVVPVERIIDVVPVYDTLRMETTQAKAEAYVDTTLHILRGRMENKGTTKTEVREIVKFVEKTDTLYVEKPVPYEVEKPVKYVPSFYKFTLIFFIGVVLLAIIRLILKLKFKI